MLFDGILFPQILYYKVQLNASLSVYENDCDEECENCMNSLLVFLAKLCQTITAITGHEAQGTRLVLSRAEKSKSIAEA